MSILKFINDVVEDIKLENKQANTPKFDPVKFVLESSEIAQKLIDALIKTHPNHSTFDQGGIENGAEFVADYVMLEWHLAVEHLLYMIHSSDIPYPRERMLRLHELAKEQSVKNFYSTENLENLEPDKLKWVYNRP